MIQPVLSRYFRNRLRGSSPGNCFAKRPVTARPTVTGASRASWLKRITPNGFSQSNPPFQSD